MGKFIILGVILLLCLIPHPAETHVEVGYEKKQVARYKKIEQNKVKVEKLGVVSVSKPSKTQSGSSDVESIIRAAARKYGLSEDNFVRIARCESSMNPKSVNYNYYENGHPSGLFQHLSGYWPARAADHGYAGASVFDPVANANVTASMWASGSRGLWECN